MTASHPGFVFDPQTFDDDVTPKLNVSCEIVNALLHAPADAPVDTKFFSKFIDVRDIANTHVLAIQKDNLAGQRLLLTNGAFGQQDIFNIINDDFPQLKRKIPPSNPNTDVNNGNLGCKIKTKNERLHRFLI